MKSQTSDRHASRKLVFATATIAATATFGQAAGPEDSKSSTGGTKEVAWILRLSDLVKNLNGKYELGVKTFADCAHGDKAEENPEPLLGDWDLRDGVQKDTTKIISTVTHAKATAQATVSIDPKTLDEEKRNVIKGTVSAVTTAIANPDPQGKSKAIGEAWSKVAYQVKDELKAVGVSTVRDRMNKKGRGEGAPDGHHGNWKDPIIFTISDPLSDELLLSETLFDLSVDADRADGTFEWSWDAAGVSLITPRSASGSVTGSVRIDGGTQSDWVLNPIGSFGAVLEDGVFSATGVWASLPWSLTYDGADVVSAFLPASAFSTELSLDVLPTSSLLDPDAEYGFEVSFDDRTISEASNVPQPGPMIVGVFAIGLMTQRRRECC